MAQGAKFGGVPGPVGGRIKLLIERFHGGSVNAAAPTMGVPQRTLARIVGGQSEPKADTVAHIAAVYGVPVTWLLTGDGPGPTVNEREQRSADELAWRSVIVELALPEPLAYLLQWLPRSLGALWLLTGELSGSVPGQMRDEDLAQALEHRAYTTFFRALIREYGAPEVRRFVARHATRLRDRMSQTLNRSVAIDHLEAAQDDVLGAGEGARARAAVTEHIERSARVNREATGAWVAEQRAAGEDIDSLEAEYLRRLGAYRLGGAKDSGPTPQAAPPPPAATPVRKRRPR
jgi:transcriptional regulator with XRE-family HTH domain